MRPVDRAEGYRRGAGKEEVSLALVSAFLLDALGESVARIEDPDANYRLGDLQCSTVDATIEVKGQPIDPEKYPKNFIEVFEDTSAGRLDHHAQGFDDVARRLGLAPSALAATRVQRFDRPGRPVEELGRLTHVSVSITSMFGSAATVYVNNTSTMLYFYRSADLINLVQRAVRAEGLRRGQGASNRDTHAVLVPIAALRWSRGDGAWRFVGDGPGDGRATARAILGVAEHDR